MVLSLSRDISSFLSLREALPSGGRELDSCKIVFRVQVVFAAFVDDADQLVSFSIGIRQSPIDLPKFERGRIGFIVNAHDKLSAAVTMSWNAAVCMTYAGHFRLILNSFRPTP